MNENEIIGLWKAFWIDYLKANKPSEPFTNFELKLGLNGMGTVSVKLGFLPLRRQIKWKIEGDTVKGIVHYGDHGNDTGVFKASFDDKGALLVEYGTIVGPFENNWFTFRYHMHKK